MRAASLFPLALSAALVTACGSETSAVPGREEAARTPAPPERDLTRQAPVVSAAGVASAVELSRPKPAATPTRASRPRPVPAPPAVPEPEPQPEAEPAEKPLIVPAAAVTEAAVEALPEADAAGDERELAPGKTVTVIPVSNGPSIKADEDDSWLPSERPRGILGGRDGTCRPRGGVRGVGIAGRIPVGIPQRRLR